jgi:hypothetical protein
VLSWILFADRSGPLREILKELREAADGPSDDRREVEARKRVIDESCRSSHPLNSAGRHLLFCRSGFSHRKWPLEVKGTYVQYRFLHAFCVRQPGIEQNRTEQNRYEAERTHNLHSSTHPVRCWFSLMN